ncbi:nitrogen fixation protein NifU [Microbacterium sp. Root61]|uniref:Fe-S cluster assembly sulfur transfer protein SufU n=1 Tax=Microbacterium sp. Root61 TaxID=1736570 RepID=UPI0006F25935|nr:SUF system NifU family Fe-S cluster assembly protein [Microbacterium sp. Root61]KRA24321.1 nitrogen fixation protein NifU [Microbacterium sp. Root61]
MSSELEGLYQEVILDHSRRKLGQGDIAPYAHTHTEVSPTCGDEITVGVEIGADGAVDLRWSGRGCSISTASASVMSELLEGATDETVRESIDAFRTMMRSRGAGEAPELLGDAEVFQGVSRYIMRVKCAMLPWVALEAALAKASAD